MLSSWLGHALGHGRSAVCAGRDVGGLSGDLRRCPSPIGPRDPPRGESGPVERSDPLARQIWWALHAEPTRRDRCTAPIPVIVLLLLGHDSVGYARAASTVAVGYLSVLLSTISRDYYPRAAAAEASEPALPRLMADQGRLALVLSAPLILEVVFARGQVDSLRAERGIDRMTRLGDQSRWNCTANTSFSGRCRSLMRR